MKQKPLDEQTALITGGATGIGRAFAEALLENGFKNIIIASRRQAVVDNAARELNARFGKHVFSFAFDLRNHEQTKHLVSFALDRFGAVDLLVNNSGLALPETVAELSDEGWSRVLDTNLRGAVWLTQLLLPAMLKQDFGDIVNISSQAGKHGYADVPSYCAAKAGLLGFAQAVRDDVHKRGANIRIFNFCPGLVDVETTDEQNARHGFLHVRNMAKTLIFALSLDRNIVLEDINIYSK